MTITLPSIDIYIHSGWIKGTTQQPDKVSSQKPWFSYSYRVYSDDFVAKEHISLPSAGTLLSFGYHGVQAIRVKG